MYCKGCSANIPDGSVNCDYCGADLLVPIDPTAPPVSKENSKFSDKISPEDLPPPPSKLYPKINLLSLILISFILIPSFLYLYYWWMVPHEAEIGQKNYPDKRPGVYRAYQTKPESLLSPRQPVATEGEAKEQTPGNVEQELESTISSPKTGKPVKSLSSTLAEDKKAGEISDVTSNFYQKGLDLSSEGKYLEALASFQRAYEIKGEEKMAQALASTLFSLGLEAIKAREFGEALDYFESGLKYSPKEARYHFGAGLAYFHLDNYYQALLNLHEAINLKSDDFDSLQLLGEIYYRQNRLKEATGWWKKALQIQPDDKKLAAKLAKANREEQVEYAFTESGTPNFVLRYDSDRHEKYGKLVLDYLYMAYDKVGFDLDFYPKDEITAILYSEEDFKDITQSSSWAKATFDGKIRLPITSLQASEEASSRIIFHEYTHAAIHQLTKGNIPSWLNEGLAIYEEGSLRPELEEALRKAIQNNAVFTIKELDNSFMNLPKDQAVLAYAQSYFLVKFILDSYNAGDLQEILKKLGQSKSIEKALEETLNINLMELENEWRNASGLTAIQ